MVRLLQPPQAGRRRAGAALAALLLLLGSLGTPRPVAADSVTFGTPSATATWGTGIRFTQPLSVAGSIQRAEILIDYPGLGGPLVTEVPPTGAAASLSFTVDSSQGQVLPNTTLTARWRITLAGNPPVVGPSVSGTYQDARFQWRTKQGDIVRLHWYQGGDAFAERAVQLGDGAIAKAANLLGVSETTPIDFYVYADQTSFYDALGPGTPENIAGEAHPEIRTMFGLITPDAIGTSEVARVVTHELTHLVFDTATKNPYDEPAHWINEGVAVYLSVGYGADDRAAVSQAAADGTIMPLPSLNGRFPTTYDRLLLAYSEAVSAIDFLVRSHGQGALVTLIRSYAKGVTDDDAFRAAIGTDMEGFDAAWLADVGARTPQRHGPQPAPAGPLPPGWTAASPVSGTAATPAPAATPSPGTTGGGGPGGTSPLVLLGSGLFVALAIGSVLVLSRRSRPRMAVEAAGPAPDSGPLLGESPGHESGAADPPPSGPPPDPGERMP